ncbi:MAG: glycogen synthase [Pyrinomonadaceae bacterium]|nr:glycogen synthase [Pyrinomonadaceae bacterium]
MRVAILSSEAVPYAKTGGLGDVAGALPKALRETNGADAALILPLYETTDRNLLGSLIIDNLEVEWHAGGSTPTRVFYSTTTGAPAFLIDAPRYFARPGIYGYRDDYERFAFFCRAALALLKRLGNPPDVVHGNDWHSGFAIAELAARRHYDSFYSNTRTVFSIHNLAYQGAFDPAELPRLGFANEWQTFETDGTASGMKAGLAAADVISTVSRRYALEIQMPEHGYGLDWLLRLRRDRLVGITNGIDYDVWNPATDPHTAARYDANDLGGKGICKLDLLRQFNLPEESARPIVASISRLIPQKGYDLIREAAVSILESGAFFIALGSGARENEDFLQALRDYAPHRVGVYLGFNEQLAHKIEAGADIFLMPSLYEPCGLNQMYSTRYGTVPVVRATGGLDDTVQNFDRARGDGNGFKFERYSTGAMVESLYEAVYCYHDREAWRKIQWNGMREDNSWQRAARRYTELYHAAARM